MLCPNEYIDLVTFNAHWLDEHKDVPNMNYFIRNIETVRSNRKIWLEFIFLIANFIILFSLIRAAQFRNNYSQLLRLISR